MAYDPLTGKYTPDPATTTPNVAYRPESGTTIPGYSTISQYVDTRVAAMPVSKKVLKRTPRRDSAGNIIGWDLVYDDGSIGFESNPDYKKDEGKSKNIAYSTMEEILKSYGITGIASVLEEIRLEYPEASSADIMTLLQFDSRYNKKFNERFSANAARQAAGLTILSPATYLAMEQGYKEVFNKYNLADFNTQAYYDKLISADVKVTDVNDRVILAFDRVLNDTQTTNAFKKFYPSLNTVNIVTAMLDPVNQLPALQRKVKAAEIGGAALRQNLLTSENAAVEAQQNVPFTNVTRATLGADVLGQEGITKAQAEAGYSKIATELPTAEKLSSIYSGRLGQYGMLEAEQDVFRGLASARRAKERLVSTEIAAFGGTAGTTQGSLKKKSLGQI